MRPEQQPPYIMTGPNLTTGILEINMLTLRNKFEALQEKSDSHTPNDEYKNFINVHLKTAAKCIPTK